MKMRSSSLVLAPALLVMLGCSSPAAAQDFSGRWIYTEAGDTAAVVIRLDEESGRFTGSIQLFGREAPMTGHVAAGRLTVDSLAGSPTEGTMTGYREGDALLLAIAPEDAGATVLRLTRASLGQLEPPAGSAPADAASPVSAAALAGEWEMVSDDGTYRELVQLSAAGERLEGSVVAVERGYFTGRDEVQRQVAIEGVVRGGRAVLSARDAATGETAQATAFRRGEYLVLRIGDHESGYARPGEPLVESAMGNAAAEALARSITGRIYSSSSQASGRNGGFVGQRVRLALCSDGTVAFDASDVASVPGGMPDAGMDYGSGRSRRGTWGIVLLAGAPVVRAQWEGTGTTYSLTEYFRIRPTADGATVDGTELPATGSC
jgi:hypothetical protein